MSPAPSAADGDDVAMFFFEDLDADDRLAAPAEPLPEPAASKAPRPAAALSTSLPTQSQGPRPVAGQARSWVPPVVAPPKVVASPPTFSVGSPTTRDSSLKLYSTLTGLSGVSPAQMLSGSGPRAESDLMFMDFD